MESPTTVEKPIARSTFAVPEDDDCDSSHDDSALDDVMPRSTFKQTIMASLDNKDSTQKISPTRHMSHPGSSITNPLTVADALETSMHAQKRTQNRYESYVDLSSEDEQDLTALFDEVVPGLQHTDRDQRPAPLAVHAPAVTVVQPSKSSIDYIVTPDNLKGNEESNFAKHILGKPDLPAKTWISPAVNPFADNTMHQAMQPNIALTEVTTNGINGESTGHRDDQAWIYSDDDERGSGICDNDEDLAEHDSDVEISDPEDDHESLLSESLCALFSGDVDDEVRSSSVESDQISSSDDGEVQDGRIEFPQQCLIRASDNMGTLPGDKVDKAHRKEFAQLAKDVASLVNANIPNDNKARLNSIPRPVYLDNHDSTYDPSSWVPNTWTMKAQVHAAHKPWISNANNNSAIRKPNTLSSEDSKHLDATNANDLLGAEISTSGSSPHRSLHMPSSAANKSTMSRLNNAVSIGWLKRKRGIDSQTTGDKVRPVIEKFDLESELKIMLQGLFDWQAKHCTRNPFLEKIDPSLTEYESAKALDEMIIKFQYGESVYSTVRNERPNTEEEFVQCLAEIIRSDDPDVAIGNDACADDKFTKGMCGENGPLKFSQRMHDIICRTELDKFCKPLNGRQPRRIQERASVIPSYLYAELTRTGSHRLSTDETDASEEPARKRVCRASTQSKDHLISALTFGLGAIAGGVGVLGVLFALPDSMFQ